MKLVGITGKSGSGKTTFSNILAQYPDVGVVHIDDLIKRIKDKYLKQSVGIFMEKEKKQDNIKIKPGFKQKILNNSVLLEMFLRARTLLSERMLEEEIKRLEQEGKKTVIIDDLLLKYHKCYKKLDFVILMQRPYVERAKSLEIRQDATKQEIVNVDIIHHKTETMKNLYTNRTVKIVNNKGEEELAELAKVLYEKHLAPFKSKYKVEGSKLNQVTKGTKTREKMRNKSRGE